MARVSTTNLERVRALPQEYRRRGSRELYETLAPVSDVLATSKLPVEA